jgi:hypothetical protein
VCDDPKDASLVAVFDEMSQQAPARLGPALARYRAGSRGVTVYRSSSR